MGDEGEGDLNFQNKNVTCKEWKFQKWKWINWSGAVDNWVSTSETAWEEKNQDCNTCNRNEKTCNISIKMKSNYTNLWPIENCGFQWRF